MQDGLELTQQVLDLPVLRLARRLDPTGRVGDPHLAQERVRRVEQTRLLPVMRAENAPSKGSWGALMRRGEVGAG